MYPICSDYTIMYRPFWWPSRTTAGGKIFTTILYNLSGRLTANKQTHTCGSEGRLDLLIQGVSISPETSLTTYRSECKNSQSRGDTSTPGNRLSEQVAKELHNWESRSFCSRCIPYSGKQWRGINFGKSIISGFRWGKCWQI